jgi:hypothetical protein
VQHQAIHDADARRVVQWFSRCGHSVSEIERRTGLRHSFVWTWAQRQTPEILAGRGRPRLIGQEQGVALKKSIVKVRFAAARHLLPDAPKNPRTGRKVSVRTLERTMHRAGSISVRTKKKQGVRKVPMAKRLAWCERHEAEGTDFATWLFSDEKWWKVGGMRGNERIWVDACDPDPPERYVDDEPWPVKVMIWGAISYHGRSTIHFFDGSVDSDSYQECIREALLPALHHPDYLGLSKAEKYVFQQDGASCHTSQATQKWVAEQLPANVQLNSKEDWPPKSYDLSPIERLWAILQNKTVEEMVNDVDSLIKCVTKWWWKIPQSTIQKLYDEMPNRIAKCIGAKGGRFRY